MYASSLTTEDLNRQLWQAAREGNCAKIRLAVMSGADLYARDEQERTALNISTQYGHVEAARTILAARQAAYIVRMGLDARDFYDNGKASEAANDDDKKVA